MQYIRRFGMLDKWSRQMLEEHLGVRLWIDDLADRLVRLTSRIEGFQTTLLRKKYSEYYVFGVVLRVCFLFHIVILPGMVKMYSGKNIKSD